MKTVIAGVLIFVVLLSVSPLQACSDFIMSGTNPVVSARTMDFEMNQYNAAVLVPRKLRWTSHAPWWGVIVQDGVKWKNKYGFVGIDLLGGVEWIQKIFTGRKYSDGMNEAGLSAAILWLDATEFSEVKKAEMGLSARDLISYTLGSFGTVAEVKKGFSPATVTVWDEDLLGLLNFTLHLVVHDKDGKSLVIEWVNGKPPKMYDDNNGTNQYKGVLTNDPTYPDQKTYLEGFSKLTNKDGKDPTTGDYIEGSGLKTLPGDYTPKSRFVRPAILSQFALTEPTVAKDWKVQQAFHIIHNSQATVGENHHSDVDSFLFGGRFYTLWTIVRDHTNRKIYFTGTRNQSPRVIDLSKLNFDRKKEPEPRTLALMDEYANPIELKASDPSQTLNADVNFSGDQFGLNITVPVPVSDQGKNGKYFIFAKTTAGKILSFDGQQWVERGSKKALLPCGTGALETKTFTVLQDAPLKTWERAQFFSGFGKNEWEMFLKAQFGLVYEAAQPDSNAVKP
jgi:choloylglycine hydrolase